MATKYRFSLHILGPTLLCGAVLALAVWGPPDVSIRKAEAVGDLPPGGVASPPNVFLIMDTSANQNANMGNASVPNNTLGGYKGPTKKYMAWNMVLTGQIAPNPGGNSPANAPATCGNNNCQANKGEDCNTCPQDCGVCPGSPTCGDGACNGTEDCSSCSSDCGTCPALPGCGDGTCGADESCSTCQTDCGSCPDPGGSPNAGILDLYVDEMRFGFAGIDNSKNTSTNQSGEWSYGPNTSGTQYSFSYSGGVGSIVPDGTGSGNTGLKNRNAGSNDFRMVPLYESPDKATDNATIQDVILNGKLTSNTTGLMAAFADAYYYFENDFPVDSGGNDCGDKYIIYLAAGTPGNKEDADAEYWIRRLDADLGVKTYVVGLVKDGESKEDEIIAYADLLARAGGGVCANDPEAFGPSYGTCAYIARGASCSGSDPDCDLTGTRDLAHKLGTVLSIILNQVTSRTRLATADAPILQTSTGQWRVNAFFQTFPKGGPWRGFLRAGEVDPTGTIVQEINFDQKLNDRSPSSRVIYTSDTSGKLAPLSSVLSSDFSTFVAEERQRMISAGKPCLASAFFDSPSEWYRMLSGGTADNLSSSDCVNAPDDAELVQSFQGHKLGDIYHSSPVVMGPPSLLLNDPNYQQFLLDQQNRPTVIFTGANDGMLHAFYLRHDGDPTKIGEEAWAYVPRTLIDSLPDRILNHRFYVDAPVIVRDVQKRRDDPSPTDWATVLVGSFGRGGAMFFAMDVTDPENPELLWEFTDSLLSRAYGEAAIGRVFIGGSERPVAFLQGGYNTSAIPGSEEGYSLYVVDLFTGDLIKRFSNADGNVSPALDAPLSGSPTTYEDMPTTFSTRVFLGDLKGRLWRVDTSSTDPADWRMTRLFPAAGDPVYDTATYQRPIFLAPSVALDPARRLVVYYGTGNIEDLDVAEENYFFAVRERAQLVGGNVVYDGEILSDPPVTFAIDEKLTGEAVIFNGVVLFTTFSLGSSSSCGFGEGRLYALDYLSGNARINDQGQLTYDGDPDALNYITLGPGVPTAPIIRQAPVGISFDAYGNPNMTGGQFQALIQTGAGERTDEISPEATLEIDLGTIRRRADILEVVEIE